jgi:hypothetical protein
MKNPTIPKKAVVSSTMALLALATATQAFADLTNGLVAYWPFDNATGCNNQTPDLIHGYDMKVIYGGGNASGPFLTNFNPNLYLTNDAVRGNAVYVDNTIGPNQMALAFVSVNTNDLAPVNRYSPSSNTVSFWVKTNPGKPPANSDQRIWCESDYIRTLASVLDISAVGGGYDVFIRQGTNATPPYTFPTYGNFSGGNHDTGGGGVGSTIADNTWHNVTIITTNATTTNLAANWFIYVDGVMDPTFNAANSPNPPGSSPKGDGLWKLDTVALFALVRNGNAGFITNCYVDDLAEWSRVLSTNEIADYMLHGITNAGSAVAPVSISQFSSDLFAVNQGGHVILTWQVSSDATSIKIDNGIGEVSQVSTCGVGSTNIVINANTTFTLTVTRGPSTATKSVTITTTAGAAPNWNYVGNFNDLPSSNILGNQGNWQSLSSSPQTQFYNQATVLPTVTGNNILGLPGLSILTAGFFGNHSIGINASNTLFFRFYMDGSINSEESTNPADPNFGIIPDVDVNVGVSEAVLFDLVTFTETNQTGPAINILRNTVGAGGPIDLTADWGANNTSGFSWIASVNPNGLQTNTVYNVWIDVYNNPNDPTNNIANYYGVTVQEGGDSGTLHTLFSNQPSDESTNHNETLDKVFVCANKAPSDNLGIPNAFRLDDFYVSSNGFNHTVPIPQGSFIIGTPVAPGSIKITNVSRNGNTCTLNWSPTPGGTYTYSVYSRSDLATGSWAPLVTGLSSASYTDPAATGSPKFYRVTSP